MSLTVYRHVRDLGHSAVQTAAELQDNYSASVTQPGRRQVSKRVAAVNTVSPDVVHGLNVDDLAQLYNHPRPLSTSADREMSSATI